jgi:hypothetical protein
MSCIVRAATARVCASSGADSGACSSTDSTTGEGGRKTEHDGLHYISSLLVQSFAADKDKRDNIIQYSTSNTVEYSTSTVVVSTRTNLIIIQHAHPIKFTCS